MKPRRMRTSSGRLSGLLNDTTGRLEKMAGEGEEIGLALVCKMDS